MTPEEVQLRTVLAASACPPRMEEILEAVEREYPHLGREFFTELRQRCAELIPVEH